MTGDLTIHGVTHEVTLDVEGPTQEIKDPYGKQRVGMSATAKLNRKDFGLVWNAALETGGVMVGDEVNVEELELRATSRVDTATGYRPPLPLKIYEVSRNKAVTEITALYAPEIKTNEGK